MRTDGSTARVGEEMYALEMLRRVAAQLGYRVMALSLRKVDHGTS